MGDKGDTFSMLAYTPSAPPLTPAARAEIVAALCERAKRKQAANVAASAAAKASWDAEMALIRQSQRRSSLHTAQQAQFSAPEPVLLLMPASAQDSATTPVFSSSPSLYETASPTTTADSVSTDETTQQMEEKKLEIDAISAQSTAVVADVKMVGDVITSEDEESNAHEKSTVSASETGVVRPSVVDAIKSSLEKLQSRPEKTERQFEEKDDEKTSLSSSPLTPSDAAQTVEASVYKYDSQDEGRKAENEGKEVAAVTETEVRVIRPSLIDAIQSMFSNMELVKRIRMRAQKDTNVVKETSTAFNPSGEPNAS